MDEQADEDFRAFTHGQQCAQALVRVKCGPALKLSGHGPADLGEFSAAKDEIKYGQITFVYGPVAAAVTYVKVSLATGTVLTLQPVRAYGERFVGFAASRGTIERVTAYSRRGVLATLKIVAWSP